MAQFSIKPENALKIVADEKKFIQELAGYEDEIRHISSALGFRVASAVNIRNRLRGAADRADICQNRLQSMETVLAESVNAYCSTENAILTNIGVKNRGTDVVRIPIDPIIPRKTPDRIYDPEPVARPEKTRWWDDFVGPFIGGLGPFGALAKTIGDAVAGGSKTVPKWVSAIASDLSYVWKAGFDVCKVAPYVGWAKAILGLNMQELLPTGATAVPGWQSAKSAFAKSLGDAADEFGTKAGFAKQAGGILLSLVGNAFSNYEECQNGEISGWRAVAETAMETAVGWGKDTLISAGVAAGIAALGVTGAPLIIATGVGFAVVSVGADWVCNQMCGDGVTEVVSDFVLDRMKLCAETRGKEVKKGVETVWKGVCGIWNAFNDGRTAAFA